jgi:hypothetical protein
MLPEAAPHERCIATAASRTRAHHAPAPKKPARAPQLHGDDGHADELVDVVKLGVAPPVRRQQPLHAGHVERGNVRVGRHHALLACRRCVCVCVCVCEKKRKRKPRVRARLGWCSVRIWWVVTPLVRAPPCVCAKSGKSRWEAGGFTPHTPPPPQQQHHSTPAALVPALTFRPHQQPRHTLLAVWAALIQHLPARHTFACASDHTLSAHDAGQRVCGRHGLHTSWQQHRARAARPSTPQRPPHAHALPAKHGTTHALAGLARVAAATLAPLSKTPHSAKHHTQQNTTPQAPQEQHTRTRARAHTHTHTHAHARAHTHTHTHAHLQAWRRWMRPPLPST